MSNDVRCWHGGAVRWRVVGAISSAQRYHHITIVEGKFRSQTSDNMDKWKAEMGRLREEKRRRKRKSQKKEDPGARKGRKVAKHCVFTIIWGSGGSKSRLAKAAGAEPAGQMRDEKLHISKHISKSKCAKHTMPGPLLKVEMSKKCTPLWREAHFEVKTYATH